MVNYGVIEEKMCDSCMGEYITYGIGAYTYTGSRTNNFCFGCFSM